MTHLVRYLSILISVLVTAKTAQAESLVLEWNASTSPGVTGYNVYYGTNSGNYIYKADAGGAMTATISNLVAGNTYYFVATAYDANGDESPFSTEISFVVPSGPVLDNPAPGAAPGTLSFTAVSGHSYEIQATSDLQTWTSIWQSDVVSSNVWTQYVDPDAATFAQRFYRLVMH